MHNAIQFPLPGPEDDYTEPDPPEDPEEITCCLT